MSYLIVSGESPRNCMFEVVETEAEIADAVARAVYGSVTDALAEPEAHRLLVQDFIANEELSFEDGFVRLYQGQAGHSGFSSK